MVTTVNVGVVLRSGNTSPAAHAAAPSSVKTPAATHGTTAPPVGGSQEDRLTDRDFPDQAALVCRRAQVALDHQLRAANGDIRGTAAVYHAVSANSLRQLSSIGLPNDTGAQVVAEYLTPAAKSVRLLAEYVELMGRRKTPARASRVELIRKSLEEIAAGIHRFSSATKIAVCAGEFFAPER